jgi:hypothetical protein
MAGDRMVDVVLYVYEHPDGVRRGDVAKALKLEPQVAGVYLARAERSGRLQRAERGLYTPVTSVSLLRPGTADPRAADVTHNTRNTPPEDSAPANPEEGGDQERLPYPDDDGPDPGRFTR